MNKNLLMSRGLRLLAALGATSITVASTTAAAAEVDGGITVARLADAYARGLASLMTGDAAKYITMIGGLSDDFVLMSPFGGEPSFGKDYTPDQIDRMGRFFRDGDFKQDLVASYHTDDMVVLATIEDSNVEVGGLARQSWKLRVTSVFVRRDGKWMLAHRHADPLVAGVPLGAAAALARGEGRPQS